MKNKKVQKFFKTLQDVFEVLDGSIRQKPVLVVTPSGDKFKITDVEPNDESVVISVHLATKSKSKTCNQTMKMSLLA